MPGYQVDVQVRPQFVHLVAVDALERVIQDVLRVEKQRRDVAIALVVTDDEEIRELNRRFREVDRATDVLAFPAGDASEFVTPEHTLAYLGDVVVSYPTAAAQAAERGHPVEHELALLVAHGCLHLLGYDHADQEGRQRMWARQDEILKRSS